MPKVRRRKVWRNSIVVRRATLRDIETLVEQRHAMHEEIHHRTKLEHRNGEMAYRKFIRDMTRKRRFVAFLAFDGNRPKESIGGGCLWLRDTQPRPAARQILQVPYLMSMYTEPPHRGKGVASAIVREAMRWSKEQGFPVMTLHASEMGRGVYSKLGWKQTSEMRIRLA